MNKFGVLFVDDELTTLKYFRAMLDPIAPVFTAQNAEEGLAQFRAHPGEIGVVLSDQRMPGASGIEFLKTIRSIDPNPIRMLVTAFSDLELAVQYLNEGLIYSYLTKPWDPDDLVSKLNRAMDRYWICQEKAKILQRRSHVVKEMVMAEKAAHIGIILAGLHHHLRNSMTVIQGFFDMIPIQLKKDFGDKPGNDRFWMDQYRNAEEHLSQVNSFISSLQEVSFLPDDQPALQIADGIDLEKTIEEAGRKVLGAEPSIRFVFLCKVDQPIISADQRRVEECLRALIEEAQKNIVIEGTVTVSLSEASLSGKPALRICVNDDGAPLPPHERRRLFDPFFVRSDRPADWNPSLLNAYLTAYYHGGEIQALPFGERGNSIELILPVTPFSRSDAGLTSKIMDDRD